jgi:hypothetical protein
MPRRVFTGVVAVVALLFVGGPAFAAPSETDTTTQKNLVVRS